MMIVDANPNLNEARGTTIDHDRGQVFPTAQPEESTLDVHVDA